MKKAFLVAAAVVLLVAGPAPAKSVTVDITARGFQPGAVTVAAGDVVTWTNKDTANHQVVCAACPYTSPVLAPGQSSNFTFTKVGKFTTVDPLNKNKKGTVTVTAAPPTLSLSVNPRVLTYGATTTLSGALSTGLANQKLDILAQPCGENAAKVIGNATTTTSGNFTFQTQPTLNTSYQVRDKAGAGAVTSSAVPASIRPVVKLTRVARGKFSAQVVAAQSFVGKAVVFQRWVAARHKWTTVKTVFLGTRAAASTPLAGSTVSSTTFKVRLRSNLRVRAVLPPGQAASCYVAASSATIRS
jgi:plastocyanin